MLLNLVVVVAMEQRNCKQVNMGYRTVRGKKSCQYVVALISISDTRMNVSDACKKVICSCLGVVGWT